jgi:hypothetical protein
VPCIVEWQRSSSTVRQDPTQESCIGCNSAENPPVALLASTHSLAILWRFNPKPPADATSQLRASASAIAADRDDKWNAVAARMHEEGYCTNQPTTKIAVVLRYLYDQRPPMSLRAIGSQPEVALHHDTVGKIRDRSGAVLASASAGDR